MSDNIAESIKVFISYSHDSPEHLERVLKLSNRLRRDGIDCIIDQYEMSPREGWPLWTMSQIEEARFVLIVCTETYHRRVRGKEAPGKGLGARWEGAILTQALYESEAASDKFIPVLFSSTDSAHIPVYLRNGTHYVLDDDYEDLYRRLTNQPKQLKPALGKLRSMPPLDRKENFLPVGEKPNPPTRAQSRGRVNWIIGSLAGAVLVLLLLWWLIPRAPVQPDSELSKQPDSNPIANYRVHVTVVDPQRVPISDADVQASAGDKPKKVEGGWEFDIPDASKPADGKVTISASRPGTSLFGQGVVVLDKALNPAIEILLREGKPPISKSVPLELPNRDSSSSAVKPAPPSQATSVHVKGVVIDSSSQPIAGAWVNVVGYEQERIQTGANGEFDLVAHAAKGEIVQLRAQKEGYQPEPQSHPAGSISMTIILRRGRQ
jgi:hypothetical protein